jgi:hypothetical protein
MFVQKEQSRVSYFGRARILPRRDESDFKMFESRTTASMNTLTGNQSQRSTAYGDLFGGGSSLLFDDYSSSRRSRGGGGGGASQTATITTIDATSVYVPMRPYRARTRRRHSSIGSLDSDTSYFTRNLFGLRLW